MTQVETDRQNEVFWSGSRLAAQLGIRDDSPQSLAKFDQWYFDFYPYLFRYIPFGSVAGHRVLEVGLGYGTVAERLAASGAEYHGLDIAAGPVAMVSKRLQRLNRFGDVRCGSILDPPFEPASFDRVVAIGSLHHTGNNLQLAIHRVFKLLKPADPR